MGNLGPKLRSLIQYVKQYRGTVEKSYLFWFFNSCGEYRRVKYDLYSFFLWKNCWLRLVQVSSILLCTVLQGKSSAPWWQVCCLYYERDSGCGQWKSIRWDHLSPPAVWQVWWISPDTKIRFWYWKTLSGRMTWSYWCTVFASLLIPAHPWLWV